MAGDTRTVKVVVTGDSSSARRALHGLSSDARAADRHIGGMAASLARWGGRAVIALGAAVGGAELLGLKTAAMYENAEMAFTTMLGSGKKARAFLDDLREFAKKTPFEMEDLMKNTQYLMAMGWKAEEVLPTLTAVGDAAAGMGKGGESIQFITRALGQMLAKGKVSGEELRQLNEQGIKAQQMLADYYGVSLPRIFEMVEDGEVPASKALKVIISGMEKGTKSVKGFGGMMEKQSKTVTGKLSTMKDSVKDALADLNKGLFPVINKGMTEITNGVDDFMAALRNKAPEHARGMAYDLGLGIRLLGQSFKDGKVTSNGFLGVMQRIGQVLGVVWRKLTEVWQKHKDTIIVFGKVLAVILVLKVAFGVLAAVIAAVTSPVVLIVAAIAILITTLIRCYQTNETFRKIVDTAWKVIVRVVKWAWQTVIYPVFKAWLSWMGKIWTGIRAIATVVKVMWDLVVEYTKAGVKWWVDKFLGAVGTVINAAAKAFGWVPGIGPKLKEAAAKFNTFRDNVNKSLSGVKDKKVTIAATMSMTAGGATITSQNFAKRHGMAYGGPVKGGVPGRDSVPAMLMPDEFVIRRDGSNLADAMAYYGAKRYANGGLVVNTSLPSGSAVWNTVSAGADRGIRSVIPTLQRMFAIGQYSGNGGVDRWASLVMRVLGELRQPLTLVGAVLRRIGMESGGNPYAINRWDSNARAGYPSQGLMQTIPGTFAAYAGPYRSLGITNPLANIYAGLNYAIHRYGSIAAIDPRVRPYGYDSGGMLPPGLSLAYNGTGRPEPVGHDLKNPKIEVNVTVMGNVTTERDLVKAITLGVRDELLRHAHRNGGRTGLPV